MLSCIMLDQKEKFLTGFRSSERMGLCKILILLDFPNLCRILSKLHVFCFLGITLVVRDLGGATFVSERIVMYRAN